MIHVPKQAMILAAGLGKRMRPLTDTIPKPLIEVHGSALIDRAIAQLELAGVEKIIVNTSYKADLLEAHLQKYTSPQIILSYEEEPLETGGGIAKALHHFNDMPFFCINGDVIWIDHQSPALKSLAQKWNNDLDAVLLLHPTQTAIGYEGKGDFNVADNGDLIRRESNEKAPYIYTGIQMLHPRLFQGCPAGAFSLNLLYDKAINAFPTKIKAIVHDGVLLNVGDPTGVKLAEEYIKKHTL